MVRQSIIYLDHAAATPVDERVIAAMTPYFREQFYNPSSPYLPAVQVKREYEAAKQSIAQSLGVQADELIMTAGATESIALAFAGVNGHVVVSAIEHPAVLNAAKRGKVTIVPVSAKGRVDLQAIKNALQDDTVLVSIGLANSEIGTIQPIRAITEVIDEFRQARRDAGNTTPLWFHCDASQGPGQIDVQPARLGVDMLTINAGKIYGPKQVGLLWAKPGVEVASLMQGGGQERGLRGGTENVAGVIGFATALELAVKHRKSEAERLSNLRNQLQAYLLADFPEAVLSGDLQHRLPGHLHISFPGIDAERLVFLLEAQGVLVATGSACAANKATRSHVLEAIGLDEATADGSLRLTLGLLSDQASIQQAAQAITEAVRSEQQRMSK